MRRDDIKVQAEQFLGSWFEVRRLIQSLNFNRFQAEGLSATQFTLLNLLNVDRGTNVSELASRLNVHPATVVRSLDSLEHRGLVVRSRNPSDRREVLVSATAKGRTMQNSARGDFTDHILQIFRSMSVEGRTALVRGYTEFAVKGRELVSATKPRADH